DRARDDRTGHDAKSLGPRQVVLERKMRRRVALVRYDREAVVDDVKMAVEQPALLRKPGCGAEGSGSAAGEEGTAGQAHRVSPLLLRRFRGTDGLDRRRGSSTPWRRTKVPRSQIRALCMRDDY